MNRYPFLFLIEFKAVYRNMFNTATKAGGKIGAKDKNQAKVRLVLQLRAEVLLGWPHIWL